MQISKLVPCVYGKFEVFKIYLEKSRHVDFCIPLHGGNEIKGGEGFQRKEGR